MTTAPVSKKLGLLVGGGPAPGINGVITAATIEAINQGAAPERGNTTGITGEAAPARDLSRRFVWEKEDVIIRVGGR